MVAHRNAPPPTSKIQRLLAAAMLAVVALGSTAAAPAAGSPDTAYSVVVTPGDVTLCPGETEQVAVRITRQVTRTVRSRAVPGRAGDVRRGQVRASGGDPAIASASPRDARIVPLQFSNGGRSQHSGAWFTVTGGKIGDTLIDFSPINLLNAPSISSGGGPGVDDLATLGTRPTGQVAVHVRCKFRVTLNSTWTWLAEDITRTGYFMIPNVSLNPDSDGKFEVDAPVSSRNIRSGPCGGADTSGGGNAHFSGRISPDGLLNVTVTFTPLATTGTEGCKGKSNSGSAEVQPLTIIANVATGQRHFFFPIPHNVVADGATHVTDTLVYITVIQ